MAYHTTRPPIAVTFPKPIVALLQRCWNASADVSTIYKPLSLIPGNLHARKGVIDSLPKL